MTGKIMKLIIPILGLTVLSLTLSACGQKGPLYLPQKTPVAKTTVKKAAPAKVSEKAKTPSTPHATSS